MKDHGPHSEGKTTGPKRVTPKAPITPIVLMIGIRAHDRRPWETMGDHRPEARDTHPAPNGPNCAHDRRPCETAGPKRVIPACDHRPERVIPTRLMIGDHGRPQLCSRPETGGDRRSQTRDTRPRPQARARDTHPAHDRRPGDHNPPANSRPPIGPYCAQDRRPWRPQAPKRVTPTRPQLAPIVLMIGDHVGEHRPERVTPTRPHWPQLRS